MLLNKTQSVIFDLDGVIADLNGRAPHKVETAAEDKCYQAAITLLTALSTGLTDVVDRIILTGRYEMHRSLTEEWLNKHRVSYTKLIMRDVEVDPSLVGMPNPVFKAKMYREQIEPEHDVLFVVDDREDTIRMWHDLGIDAFHYIPRVSVIASKS